MDRAAGHFFEPSDLSTIAPRRSVVNGVGQERVQLIGGAANVTLTLIPYSVEPAEPERAET
jgi:hypothetical protein